MCIIHSQTNGVSESRHAIGSVGDGPGTTWSLRNLTTRQYVRCVPSKPGEQQCRGYVIHKRTRAKTHLLRVDDVLLMYCCWTTPRLSDDPEGIHNGSWAGHCFDIVSQEVMDPVRHEWEDVTDDVVAEAVRIRGSNRRPPYSSSGLPVAYSKDSVRTLK